MPHAAPSFIPFLNNGQYMIVLPLLAGYRCYQAASEAAQSFGEDRCFLYRWLQRLHMLV
ncbi:hypothetical protein D3C80_1699820 [compost metagenome]